MCICPSMLVCVRAFSYGDEIMHLPSELYLMDWPMDVVIGRYVIDIDLGVNSIRAGSRRCFLSVSYQ